MGDLGHFRNVLRDAADAASFRGPVLKTGLSLRFDEADNGIKNEPTISMTATPGTGLSFNM